MPVCPKCHRFKKKSVYNRHKKDCIPTREDIIHYHNSKGGSELAKEKKRKRKAQKKRK